MHNNAKFLRFLVPCCLLLLLIVLLMAVNFTAPQGSGATDLPTLATAISQIQQTATAEAKKHPTPTPTPLLTPVSSAKP